MPVAVSGRSKRQVSSRIESTSLLLPLLQQKIHKKKLHRHVNCVNCVDVLEEAQQWNLCPGSSLSTKHGFWTKPWWNWNSCAFVHLYRPYLKGCHHVCGIFRWFQVIKSRSQVSPTSPEGENFDPQGTFGRKLRELLERNQEMIQIMEAEKIWQQKNKTKQSKM